MLTCTLKARTAPPTAHAELAPLVRAFAEYQPVTSIVNAIRNLFTQQPVGTDIWIALAWCVGILIVAYVFAMVTYRRRIS